MAGAQKQMMIEQAVAAVASQLEHQLDAQLDRLDNMGEQDLEQIRKARVQDMKRKQEKTKEWLAKGEAARQSGLAWRERAGRGRQACVASMHAALHALPACMASTRQRHGRRAEPA
eukprot:353141-Chlamydomonas_euryale.AAC.3